MGINECSICIFSARYSDYLAGIMSFKVMRGATSTCNDMGDNMIQASSGSSLLDMMILSLAPCREVMCAKHSLMKEMGDTA
eukprot:16267843-Heterocapsa_arctica.AAC.2